MAASNDATQTIVSRTLVSSSIHSLGELRRGPFHSNMVTIALGKIETASSDHIFAPYRGAEPALVGSAACCRPRVPHGLQFREGQGVHDNEQLHNELA
jgi:hypothetical protein